VAALPLGELGGCLERWAKGDAKKGPNNITKVFQSATNVHQENEHDESERSTCSHGL